MRREASESLHGQAETLVSAATAAAAWFRLPAPTALAAARTARLRAAGWRDAAAGALKRAQGLKKLDASDLSFALREAVEHSAQSADEAARWGVEPDPELLRAAEAVREAAKALTLAVASKKPRERADLLVGAKKWAFEVERLRRGVRADAHEDPSTARGLKREGVVLRLSNAAEAVQQACDALSGSLAE